MMHSPPRLLVVEDDAVSAAFLSEALAGLPATVDVAGDIRTAALLVQDGLYSLWLVDQNLPDGSGMDCLQVLRKCSTSIPAVAITAEAHRDGFDVLCAAGFVEVLQKPISVSALQMAIRRILPGAGASGSNSTSAGVKLPAWDEEQALAAVGGNRATLAALRQLFIAELPGQRNRIKAAHGGSDVTSIRADLHKLKASCAFVGAARLLEAVQALSAAPLDSGCLQCFDAAVEDSLQQANPSP